MLSRHSRLSSRHPDPCMSGSCSKAKTFDHLVKLRAQVLLSLVKLRAQVLLSLTSAGWRLVLTSLMLEYADAS